jgi:class III poly(R)-hydroxyalkanoic acid synthase PhaE subunit
MIMDWTKQADVMMQTWTEAQKKMFEGWFNMAKGSSSMQSTPFPMNPDMMKQWQQMASQGVDSWTMGADPVARNVAKQLIASQEAMFRFLQLFSRGWQAMAPKIEAGEDWQSVMKQYSDQWVQTMVGGPTGMMNSGKDINELLQFYMQGWTKISQPWTQLFQDSPGNFSQVLMGGGTELAELTKLHWDVFERSFGGMTDVPGLGFNRELNAKMLKGFDAWSSLQQSSAEFQVFLSKTWNTAIEKFTEDLVAMSEKGEKIESIRDLMNMWMEIVDQTFSNMYVSEEYLVLQKKLAAGVMQNKIEQQKIMEVLLNALDLPTRSELDDAYLTMHELRKDVRAMKKQLKALSDDGKKAQAKRKSTKDDKATAGS